jgi:hypothetical protein
MTGLAIHLISALVTWLQWAAGLLLVGVILYLLTATERSKSRSNGEEARQVGPDAPPREERDQQVG